MQRFLDDLLDTGLLRLKDGVMTANMLRTLSLAAGFLFVLIVSPARAEGLLLNSGFEDAEAPDSNQPFAWEEGHSGEREGEGVATKGKIELNIGTAHSGSQSLFVRSEGPRYARATQVVDLVPGAKYRLKAMVLVADSQPVVTMGIWGWRRTAQEGFRPGTRLDAKEVGKWHPVEFEFVAPEDLAPQSRIFLAVLANNGPAEAWFDDVILEQID